MIHYFCRYCHTRKNLTKDHIIPKSRGGKNDVNNYQTLCKKCNTMKGTMTDKEVGELFKWFRYILIKREKPLNFNK